MWLFTTLDLDQKFRASSLVPYSGKNSLLRHGVVLFPSRPVDYGSDANLVSAIKAYIAKYVTISDTFSLIATYYVLFSWLYDSFNELPYLRVKGDFGSGKTRFLLTIGSICYKPMFASGASTISPIFHMIDAFRGTLLIDEADFRVSDEKAEIVKILNNGNARGFPVLRSEQSPTNEFRPRAFTVFGPKLVSTRRRYEDGALESRFITEDMNQQVARENIPLNLPSEHKEEARQLRNMLLLYRLRNFTGVRTIASSLRSVEPRLAQNFSPLLSIIEEENARVAVKKRIGIMSDTQIEERRNQLEARLLGAISEVAQEKPANAIGIGAIYSTFKDRHQGEYTIRITPRWIGGLVRDRLGLRTKKRNGVYIIRPEDTPLLAALYRRYGIGKKDELTGKPRRRPK